MSEIDLEKSESKIEESEIAEEKETLTEIEEDEYYSIEDFEMIKILCERYQEELKELGYKDWDQLNIEDFKEVLTPEEIRAARKEYKENREALIQEWEEQNGRPWPTYEEDVYSDDGRLVARKGDRLEVHHICPLKLGGKNEVKNIMPLGYKEHRSASSGIHRSGGPLSQLIGLIKKIRGNT